MKSKYLQYDDEFVRIDAILWPHFVARGSRWWINFWKRNFIGAGNVGQRLLVSVRCRSLDGLFYSIELCVLLFPDLSQPWVDLQSFKSISRENLVICMCPHNSERSVVRCIICQVSLLIESLHFSCSFTPNGFLRLSNGPESQMTRHF
jgi:hypothetical protein